MALLVPLVANLVVDDTRAVGGWFASCWLQVVGEYRETLILGLPRLPS